MGESIRLSEYALCYGMDPNIFYPTTGDEKDFEAARRICYNCPVKEACLEEALMNREHGVWGATSDKQRRSIMRRRRLDARKDLLERRTN